MKANYILRLYTYSQGSPSRSRIARTKRGDRYVLVEIGKEWVSQKGPFERKRTYTINSI